MTPRLLRLQFSLRMLLLLMLLLGVGLAIFRWPWSETKVEQHLARTTYYHRGWNGKPLKHGAETVIDNQWGRPLSEAVFEEGVLRRERKYVDGKDGGQLHTDTVFFPERSEKLEKNFIVNRARSVLTVTRTWHNLRERKEWRTLEGKLLESHEADLVDGRDLRIVRWNDLPLENAMAELLCKLPSAEESRAWLEPLDISDQTPRIFMGDQTHQVMARAGTKWVPFHGPLLPIAWRPDSQMLRAAAGTAPPPRARPMAHEWLASAHRLHRTLQLRFGVVCSVPIDAELLSQDDPTGALAVQFAEDSPQAKAWLEKVIGMDQGVVPHAKRLQHYFKDTGIEIDVRQVNLRAEYRPNLPDSLYLRSRRDTLGLFLWNHRLRVEQQGNKLIVLPRPK